MGGKPQPGDCSREVLENPGLPAFRIHKFRKGTGVRLQPVLDSTARARSRRDEYLLSGVLCEDLDPVPFAPFLVFDILFIGSYPGRHRYHGQRARAAEPGIRSDSTPVPDPCRQKRSQRSPYEYRRLPRDSSTGDAGLGMTIKQTIEKILTYLYSMVLSTSMKNNLIIRHHHHTNLPHLDRRSGGVR
jgi:hypothetical protein